MTWRKGFELVYNIVQLVYIGRWMGEDGLVKEGGILSGRYPGHASRSLI